MKQSSLADQLARIRKAADNYLNSPKYQEPTYRCPKCLDTGFVQTIFYRNRREYDGALRCDCQKPPAAP